MEACVAIAQAHALGIIHRDLKPSNLFLAKKGSERVLKLLDFGISKVLTESEAKNTSSFATLGTPHYMSPEHVRSAADVDRRSDIWSLGVILYELLTGTEPFRGDPASVIAAIVADPVPPPRTRRSDIPEALEDVIMRALEKDPRKRFPDVRALVLALAPFAPEEELVPISSMPRHLPRSFSPGRGIPVTIPPAASPRSLPVTVAEIEVMPPPRPRRMRWAALLAPVILAAGFVSWWARSSASEVPVAPTNVAAYTAPASAIVETRATAAVTTSVPSASPIAPRASAIHPAPAKSAAPIVSAAASASGNPFQL
jgi:serine/threonine protein kinase